MISNFLQKLFGSIVPLVVSELCPGQSSVYKWTKGNNSKINEFYLPTTFLVDTSKFKVAYRLAFTVARQRMGTTNQFACNNCIVSFQMILISVQVSSAWFIQDITHSTTTKAEGRMNLNGFWQKCWKLKLLIYEKIPWQQSHVHAAIKYIIFPFWHMNNCFMLNKIFIHKRSST